MPLHKDDFYIGEQSYNERTAEQGKPFVRIVSQHLARTTNGKEQRMAIIRRLEDRFRVVLEAKNCEWEAQKPKQNGELPTKLWSMKDLLWQITSQAELLYEVDVVEQSFPFIVQHFPFGPLRDDLMGQM
uniref:Tautomerase cis-CaaD-like domain-containing protein n=1 Tax=Melanopsichium pennsylvanicum 4 TaxID=1398559 RepID=A0A077RC00_9BASI|nr:conserved hypothetical protein [Melanopsichium pennsylvanicum 4]